jgi:diguanylate cyclase (GGDEF)-like protein
MLLTRARAIFGLPEQSSLRLAIAMWSGTALVGPLYAALPNTPQGHPVLLFVGTVLALALALLVLVLPEDRALSVVYPLGVVLGLVALGASVGATGGSSSALRAFGIFYVVYGAWYLPRRAAEHIVLATTLVNLAPMLYDGDAFSGAPLGWTVILSGAFLASGAAIIAVRGELTRSIALDSERLKTIVALHGEVERAEFDVEDVVLKILDRARLLLGASAASAGIIEGEEIVYRYRTGPGRNSGEAIRTPSQASLSGICLRTGEVVYCEDSEVDSRVDKAACRKQGLRSMIIVPLRHRGDVVGVLNVNSPDVRAFDANDVRTVQLTAGAICAAYGHAVDLALKEHLLDELRESEAKLSHQARHDALTDLPNRTLFLERLAQALATPDAAGVAVLFLDLDGFKVVNDNFGHDAGDHLLIQATERITAVLPDGDLVARLGGDEFVLLCRDGRAPGTAVALAERLMQVLAKPFTVGSHEAFMSASIGIAAEGGSPEELLRNADVAMYSAKASGKARYAVYDASMHAEAKARLEVSGLLGRAYASNRVSPRGPDGRAIAAARSR